MIPAHSTLKAQVHAVAHVQFFAAPWTVVSLPPLFMGFSRQEYLSGLPFSPPGDLPDPGIEPESLASPALQVDSLLLSHQAGPYSLGEDVKFRKTCCKLCHVSHPSSQSFYLMIPGTLTLKCYLYYISFHMSIVYQSTYYECLRQVLASSQLEPQRSERAQW